MCPMTNLPEFELPNQPDLEATGCWFDADTAGGRAMTTFKRTARWRQHRWAADELGMQSFGTHTRRHPDGTSVDVLNGSKLSDADAGRGINFLSPAVLAAVQARLEAKQDHQTLDDRRLFRDLLSSMPMAFNLFGEAARPEREDDRRRLADLFGVDAVSPSEIVFEWSPARRSDRYTRDRTAFDVALLLGSADGPRTAVGIETKYHEHSAREARPSASKAAARQRYDEQTDFLVAVAEKSQVFRPGWQDAVLGADLRQIWRDHLLALSMRAHPAEWTEQTRYVLLFPQRNVSFVDAARRYADLLVEGDTSFSAHTLEDVVLAAFAPDSDTGDSFRRRYLW